MIGSVSLENFKSYKSAQLQLSALTFFIGANASGKSNALEGLRMLSWLAKGSRLDDITRNIQGANTVVRGQAIDLFKGSNRTFSISCQFTGLHDDWNCLKISISLAASQLVISGESVTKPFIFNEKVPLYEVCSKANRHTDEIKVKYNNFAKGGKKPQIPCSNRQAVFYQLETPSRFGKDHQESQRVIPTVTKQIREQLKQIIFLDPRPERMRAYSYGDTTEMTEDGSNVSGVLYNICNKGGKRRDELLSFIKSLPEQDITDIKFIKTDRNDVMVRLEESFGGNKKIVDAPLLSDGTLRVLAIAATLLSAPEGAFVIIEEIDNGVHPSRAGILVNQIRRVSADRGLRVLVTTHNPALLDSVPAESIADVLCCFRDPQTGDSRITRLGDLNRYPELVGQASLGALVTRQLVDKFLKDTTTDKERKAKSLQWLKELKSEVSE